MQEFVLNDLVPYDGSEKLKGSTDTFHVFALEHPFSQDTIYCEAPVGLSVRELIGCDRKDLFVLHCGEMLHPDVWDKTYPKSGELINVVPIPGDSGTAKRLIGTVALIALAVWAAPLIPGLLGATSGILASTTFWTGAIFAVGQLILNALIPPPTLEEPDAITNKYSITGSRNRIAHYEPVPIIYGLHRTFPPYASLPYTESVGNDQYLNMLFCIGLGEYDITDVKIGDTPLLNFVGVDVEMTQSPIADDISEESLSLTILDPNDPNTGSDTFTRTTSEDTTKISIDIVLPAGLQYVGNRGDRRKIYIDFRVEYRPTGSVGAWSNVRIDNPDWVEVTEGSNDIIGVQGEPAPTVMQHGMLIETNGGFPSLNANDFRLTGDTRDSQRVTMKWTVASDQYDVKVTRTLMGQPDGDFNATESELAKYSQTFVWTALRSFNENVNVVDSSLSGKLTFLKVRILATDQLNGVIDRLNCLAQRKLRGWTTGGGGAFTSVVATRDPAWAYLDVLTGLGNSRAISDADAPNLIELSTLAAWSTLNATADNESYYDDIIDSPTSVFEILRRIAAVGKAAVNVRDGKFTVIVETTSTTPVQHFTPRNTSNFSSVKAFVDVPHALRVRFLSSQTDYIEDEIIVYDDGYTSANATKFEVLELVGVTDYEQAWRMGRYHLAVIRLRPETYSFTADIEHLVAQKGDLCKLTHDVPLIGIGAARIKLISGNQVTLDDSLTLQGSGTHAIRVRKDDGTSAVQNIVEVAGTLSTFTFTPSIPAGVKVGDLAVVGLAGTESINVKITRIVPDTADHQATITCVDAAPGVLTAHVGTIPPYDPVITVPQDPLDVQPPTARIIMVLSDINLQVLDPTGQPVSRAVVAFVIVSQRYTARYVQIRFREGTGSGQWKLSPMLDPGNGYVSIDGVEGGETYDFQIRVISSNDVSGDWSASTTATIDDNARPLSEYGNIINRDPNVSRSDLWTTYSGDPNWEIAEITDGKVGNTELRSIADASHAWVIDNTKYPVDPTKTYQIRAWVRRKSGNRQVFLAVTFYDQAGVEISSGTSDATGWTGLATQHYWSLSSAGITTLPADSVWRLYTFLFGAKGIGTIPSNAKTFTVAVILNYQPSGTTDGVVAVQDIGVTEVLDLRAWRPVYTAGIAMIGDRVRKSHANSAWDQSVRSFEAFEACSVTFTPSQTNKGVAFGLNTDPTTDNDIGSIDYALYCRDNGNVEIYEFGALIASYGAYVANTDIMEVRYDGVVVTYFRNGVPLRQVTRTGAWLYMDSSFLTDGVEITGLRFNPLTRVPQISAVEYHDDMVYLSATELYRRWTLRYGGIPNGDISLLTGLTDVPSGRAVRFGNNSGDDNFWAALTDILIPYDPNSTYEIGIILRRVTGSGSAYCGLEAVANDRSTIVETGGGSSPTGSQHWIAANAFTFGTTNWYTLKGYLRGHGSSPTLPSNDPNQPSVARTNTTFIRPVINVNFNGQAGQTDVAGLWLRRSPVIGQPNIGDNAATKTFVSTIAGPGAHNSGAAGDVTIAVPAQTIAHTAIVTVTGDFYEANTSTGGAQPYIDVKQRFNPPSGGDALSGNTVDVNNYTVTPNNLYERLTVQGQFAAVANQGYFYGYYWENDDSVNNPIAWKNVQIQVVLVFK
jgi:hypothetical protein